MIVELYFLAFVRKLDSDEMIDVVFVLPEHVVTFFVSRSFESIHGWSDVHFVLSQQVRILQTLLE